ncbi:DUF4116 domain-containing protein [Dysgonomonas sp. ZJ709]|uniref:DUF4116 domain-containing protein n=1 Tax=Dysgonomonas sp. ZJ709 TaxID=2709797 RepID=UPI0013EB5EFB|nr:DUF4116 domain-containing protein [Dysgonomonas sp. ZJ709]
MENVNKDNIYFFLEIAIEDPTKTLAKLKEIGLTEEKESPQGWLYRLLVSSQKDGVVNLPFLVSNSQIYEWDEVVHQDYQSDPKALEALLIKLDIPTEERIKEFTLNELVDQQKKDIESLINEDSTIDLIPPYKRTESVCKAALDSGSENIQWIPSHIQTDEMCLKIIKQNYQDIKYIPKNLQTEGMCQMVLASILKDIEKNPHLFPIILEFNFLDIQSQGVRQMMKYLPKEEQADINYVMGKPLSGLPKERRTDAVYTAAFIYNRDSIQYIPGEMVSNKMIEAALKENGLLLQYIDENKITGEHCLLAVKNDYEAIQFVNKKFLSPEICLIAMNEAATSFPESCLPLAYIPYPDICLEGIEKLKNTIVTGKDVGRAISENKSVINRDIAKALVDFSVENFMNIPDMLKDKQMCIDVVKINGWLLGFVPQDFRTKEMSIDAIKTNYHAMQYVPDKLKTANFYLEAIKINGNALKYVPEEFKSNHLCNEAVKNSKDYRIIEHLPYDDLCNKVIDRSIEKGQIREAMKLIKPECITGEIAYKVAKHDIYSLSMVPKELMTPHFCSFAILENPKTLRYLPESYTKKEICLEAIIRDVEAINGIPDSLKTKEFYKELIGLNPLSFIYTPKEFKDRELAELAINNYTKVGARAIGVFSSIPYPDLCLEAIRKENNPETVLDIVFHMNDKVKNGDIALEAVKKNSACLPFIPEELRIKEVCEEVMKREPKYINWVPIENRTPEMYLRAIKDKDACLYDGIPDSISNGKNIVSFNETISKKILDKLSFEQVTELYNGKTIKVSKINTSEGLKENQLVRYNKESNSLEYKSNKENISTRILNTLMPKNKNGFNI